MALVRDHRRIGRVTDSGTLGDTPVVKVHWNDYTHEIIPRHAVRDCNPEDAQDWVRDALISLATSLEYLGIADPWTVVPDMARAMRAPERPRRPPPVGTDSTP